MHRPISKGGTCCYFQPLESMAASSRALHFVGPYLKLDSTAAEIHQQRPMLQEAAAGDQAKQSNPIVLPSPHHNQARRSIPPQDLTLEVIVLVDAIWRCRYGAHNLQPMPNPLPSAGYLRAGQSVLFFWESSLAFRVMVSAQPARVNIEPIAMGHIGPNWHT